MEFENILVDTDGPVATITLNRPEKLNALSEGLRTDLHDALVALSPGDQVRVIRLKQTGGLQFRLSGGRDMLQRLQKPPFTNQLNHSDQVLRLTLKAQDAGESPDETAAQYEWALRKNPADRVLHYNYGLFLFDLNRTAALQQLSLSRPWDGFPVFAPDGQPVQ